MMATWAQQRIEGKLHNEAYEPSLAEIEEAARLIREVGYVFDGKQREPWSEERFYKAAGESKAPIEFPMVDCWFERNSSGD